MGVALFVPGLIIGTLCNLYASYQDHEVAVRSEKIRSSVYDYDRESEVLWELGTKLFREIMTPDESQLKALWEKETIDPLIKKLADLIPNLAKHMLEELELESQATKQTKEALISMQVTEKNTVGRYCWVFFQVVEIYQLIRQQTTIYINSQENDNPYRPNSDLESASEPFYQEGTSKYALRKAYNTFCMTFADLAATTKDTRFKKHTFLDESNEGYLAYLSDDNYGGSKPSPGSLGRLFFRKETLDEVLAHQK